MTDPAEGVDVDGYITTGADRANLRSPFLQVVDEVGNWTLRRVDEVIADDDGGGQ